MKSVNLTSSRSRRGPRRPGSTLSRHAVQFYEKPDAILESAGRFLEEGMRDGDAAVVVGMRANRTALEGRLAAAGIDLESARRAGSFVSLDASETLDRFTTDDWPDAGKFEDVVGLAVATAAAGARSGQARVYGEMVAVLCERGDQKAAIRLEGLWNELEKTRAFRLLCGYPMDIFRGRKHAAAFEEICRSHAVIVPGESYGLGNRRDRNRQIASLQQKAASLDVEVGHRQSAERTARLRDQELLDFLDDAPEGIHKVGPDGRILWANEAELRLLGYSADEYIGHSIREFHADEDVIAEILERLARGETLLDYPARLRCKDGSIKQVLIHSNVYREEGEFVHRRCFTRDVTERVRLEQELREKIEELALADRRKDEFLALLGHELRNPLSPMVTAVELARRRPEDGHLVARSLEVLERQTRHLTRLVDDLLDVSRITCGTISLRRETVSLAGVIESALEQTQPLIEARGHRLSLNLPPTPLLVDADPVRLEQIVANLLSNAARYTEIGGRIAVEIRREDGVAVVSVKDDGVGLSPDLRDRIFDLFVRASEAGTHAPSGLGVGLTLVRRLTEMHGGSVEARSEGLGKGSEFVVKFTALSPFEAAPSVRPDSELLPAAGPGWRILVVDDNTDAADGLAEYLRALGHSVRTAYDGSSAVDEARRSRPEIVLLDIGLPGADGHEVARRLRAEAGLKSSLLVALSGYCQESDRERSREAGFDHHFAKPVDLAKLESLLHRPT